MQVYWPSLAELAIYTLHKQRTAGMVSGKGTNGKVEPGSKDKNYNFCTQLEVNAIIMQLLNLQVLLQT